MRAAPRAPHTWLRRPALTARHAGAGIGKSRILRQLEPFNVPCIDAGYAFEVWAAPDRQWDRPYMTCDKDMDVTKVRFLSAEDSAALGVQ